MALNQNGATTPLPQDMLVPDNTYINALSADVRWTSSEIHYFIDYTGLNSKSDIDAARQLYQTAFATWASVANITFTEVSNPDAAEIVMHRSTLAGIGGWGGYSGTPGEATTQRWETLDSSTTDMINPINVMTTEQGQVHTYIAWDSQRMQAGTGIGQPGLELVIHEIGHALGLAHPHDNGSLGNTGVFPGVGATGDFGDLRANQTLYTVMSYNHSAGTVAGPMAFDIAAIQWLYGANQHHNDGDTFYRLETMSGGTPYYASIWDTSGTDWITYDGRKSVTIDLRPASLEEAQGGGGFASSVGGINGGYTIANGVVIENARGGSGNDLLIGNDAANVLNGGAAADTMRGGAGDDTYFVNHLLDVVDELTPPTALSPGVDAGGIDTVNTTLLQFSLLDNSQPHLNQPANVNGKVENLTYNGSGNFTGTGNGLDNRLSGGYGRDTLYGNGGNDTLDGRWGADTMYGGAGDDTYIIDSLLDVVDETTLVTALGIQHYADASGIDTVESSLASYDLSKVGTHPTLAGSAAPTLFGNVENLVYTGTSGFTGIGNHLANRIVGGAQADLLKGGAGNDTLVGGGGDDTMYGGSGRDVLQGAISLNSPTETNTYYIDNGDATGGDRVIGTSVGRDVVVAEFAITSGLVLDLFNTRVPATYVTTAFRSTGIDVDEVIGSDFSDIVDASAVTSAITLNGGWGDDVLTGGANDDFINGDIGADVLIGGRGADVLDGGADLDTASYADAGSGFSLDLGLGKGLTGDAAGDIFVSIEHIIGSAFNDTITGSNANETLEGGNGRNELYGGGGSDYLVGGNEYDRMEGGSGNDTLVGSGGQTAMFGGDDDDKLIGSTNNTNSFSGGQGNDAMIGGEMADYISDVDGGNDIMYGNGGSDILIDYAGANQMYGGAGDDILNSVGSGSLLDGGAGNDQFSVANGDFTLIGGSGSDRFDAAGFGNVVFTGGADADIFDYRVGAMHYTVTDFEDGVDHIALWDFIQSGNVSFGSLTIADSAAGAVISWNGLADMTLSGITAAQLTSADFLFG